MSNTAGTYYKEIIEEYNVLLRSWGHSDTWDLNRFKTLESMIFDATKVDVNANTLKRFFQQRTENPQLATRDALCRFLGYGGYADFVMKMTKKEPAPTPVPVQTPSPSPASDTNDRDTAPAAIDKPIKRGGIVGLWIAMAAVLLVVAGYFIHTYTLKDVRTEYLISKIKFTASQVKGVSPLTVTFSYDIPPKLFDDVRIVFEEANGDRLEKPLTPGTTTMNATYIYEGTALGLLTYKGREIKRIALESRKGGWSVFVRDEHKGVFEALPVEAASRADGYVSLPFESVPPQAQDNHLFVSYIFYRKDLIDGDNFILEARMRNSAEEHAIPVADIMMYMNSDTASHGFAMNENGYAYIKFISGENQITGDRHNLSRFNFNPSLWHVMTIRVVNKHTTFLVDGEEVLAMDYNNPSGMANEIILRFKGCGAVDYVRLTRPDGELVYEENFDGTTI